MLTSFPPSVRAARRSLGHSVRAGALALLLLPLLAACGATGIDGPNTTIYAATPTGAITAIDASNGAILWRYHGEGVMGMTVDPHHHTLFLTRPDGAVAALDDATGKLEWQYAIGAGDWMNKPYLVGSMVVAVAQQVPGFPVGASVIVALSARSGAPLWRVSLPGAISGDLDIHPDRIYVSVNTANATSATVATGGAGAIGATAGAGPGAVYALRATDGAQIWRAATPDALVAGPVSDQTRVYASTSRGTALALRASDGALQWSQLVSTSLPLSAMFANTTAVYVGDGSGAVRALSTTDGAALWTQTIPNTTSVLGPRVYTPADGGSGVLLSSTNSPLVYALSPRDGSVIWRQESLGFGMSPPVVQGNDAYVIATANELSIFSLANGAYVADYDFYERPDLYSSADQLDLGEIAYIAVDPSRIAT
jgi:outer membrane protein assembly factor BamB